MGGDTVGGRTYFSLGLSFVAYLVLCHSKLPYKWARRFTLLTTIFMILPAALVAVSELFPPTSKVIYPFYTGVSIEVFREGAPQVLDGTTRITSLQEVARPVVLALCAYYPPITLVNPLYFGRFFTFVITVGVAGLTGFRSLIIAISGYITISTLLRKAIPRHLCLGNDRDDGGAARVHSLFGGPTCAICDSTFASFSSHRVG